MHPETAPKASIQPSRPANGSLNHLPSLSAASLALLILIGCMPDIGKGPSPEQVSRLRKTLTQMKSSVLPTLEKALADAANPAPAEGGLCDDGKACITPLNLEGRIYSGNLMVGGNGGPPGVPVRVIEGYDATARGPETGRGGKLKFNLGTTTDLSGDYACCDGNSSYPPDDLAMVHRLELLFDYLDATFIVPSGAGAAVAGKTYTVRMVYVDTGTADDLPMGRSSFYKGDKLLKRSGEEAFHWCTESGCVSALRPESPLRASWHAETAHMAYPHYMTVGVNLKSPMSFTRQEAERGNWKFTVDFDLTRAAIFNTTDWSMIRSEADLVNAFDLLNKHGGPGGIGVDVELAKTPLDSAGVASP